MYKFTSYFLLTLLTSCSLFSNKLPFDSQKIDDLIGQIQLIGNGRGRLGIKSQQYLFGFDAVFKENSDWIFAANIPLHGEEVMVFSRLDLESERDALIDPFEGRIEQEILSQFSNRPDVSRQLIIDFREDLRALTRLILSDKIKLERECSKLNMNWKCQTGSKEFDVFIEKNEVHVKKNVDKGYILELVAQNLTGSFFTRTNIYFYSERDLKRFHPLLSLELFWR